MVSNWKAWCDVCVSGVAAYLHDLHRSAISMHIAHCARPDREASKIASFICEMQYRYTQCCYSLSGSGLGLTGPATPELHISEILECFSM